MHTINEEKLKAQCGERDVRKIPAQVEITSLDLLMFRIETKLDKVTEMGWYKEEKRKSEAVSNMEAGDEEEDNRKIVKTNGTDRRGMILGSLSLKQIEEIDKKNEMIINSLEEIIRHLDKSMDAERGKMQKEMDIMFRKIQILEEEKAR